MPKLFVFEVYMEIANQLYPNNNLRSANNATKFTINCQARLNLSSSKDTRDWLQLVKLFDHNSPDYKIYEALLEHKKHIVAKIGNATLEKEMGLGEVLKTLGLPTFLSPYCIFKCLDKITDMNQNTKYVCKEKGDTIRVLLMPYIDQGQIDKYNWNRDNFGVLKNLMKHIVASVLFAAVRVSFIHKDLHPGNILIKKTMRKSISYGIYGTIECEGYIPVIMDYDKSIIVERDDILVAYNDLKRFFINIMDNKIIEFDTSNIMRMMEVLIKRGSIAPDAFSLIIKEIDVLSVIRLKSEIPKVDWSQFNSSLI